MWIDLDSPISNAHGLDHLLVRLRDGLRRGMLVKLQALVALVPRDQHRVAFLPAWPRDRPSTASVTSPFPDSAICEMITCRAVPSKLPVAGSREGQRLRLEYVGCRRCRAPWTSARRYEAPK